MKTVPDPSLYDVYESNKLSGEDRLLVMFVYSSEEEMRLLRMHPEMIQADTTHGTNNSKKELFTLASLDGNNKGFNGGRVYIPNAQKWVFSMIFKNLLPSFWGDTIVKRNNLFMTDGCASEYMSFIAQSGDGGPFCNSVLGLCYFHIVILGYKTHVACCIPKIKSLEKDIQKVTFQLKMWVKSWFFDVESELEYNESRRMFFQWLSNVDTRILPLHSVAAIRTWIRANLDPYDTMWLNYLRLNVCGMNARTTSVGEAMHRSMKIGYDGIKASMSIDVSANTMMNKAKKRVRSCSALMQFKCLGI